MNFSVPDFYSLIECNDLDSIKKVILKNPLSVNESNDIFGTPLVMAAEAGRLEIVKYLVQSGADVNFEGGVTNINALYCAASRGHSKVLRYLLSVGAKMETKSGQQNPLLVAIARGHLECAKILIDHGIDFNVVYVKPDGSCFNALSHSVDYDRPETEEYLRSKGAKEFVQSTNPKNNSLPDLVFDWFSKNIGKPSPLVLHHILPIDNKIEICKINPGKSRPFLTLFTKGLSKIPLSNPSDKKNSMYSEIFIKLPPQWKLDNLENPNYWWPVEWLNLLASNSASEKEWLGWPIAVACREESPQPIAPNTKMDSVLLIPMHVIESNGAPDINLYQMVPLYPEERMLEKKKGAHALMQALTQSQAPLIVDVIRKNAAIAKR